MTRSDVKNKRRKSDSAATEQISNAGSIVVDERKCLFCGIVGDLDDELAGRLIFYR